MPSHYPLVAFVHSASFLLSEVPKGTCDHHSNVDEPAVVDKGWLPGVEQFAEHHASQCGFCTPGFVVACHATLARCAEDGDQATPEKMMQGLDGNLCRCTGYMPILEACKVARSTFTLSLLSLLTENRGLWGGLGPVAARARGCAKTLWWFLPVTLFAMRRA